jgi:type II secretion system protein G
MFKQSNKGFTLIELLVVIAIIGILSSVVLASMNSARKKARDARRQQDLRGLATALELAFDSNSRYPLHTTAIDIATAAVGDDLFDELQTPGYVADLQDDPLTAQSYYYISDATGTTYCLGATMEGTPPTPADTCGTLTTTGNYWVGP